MTTQETARKVAQRLIEPLCSATEQIFAPMNIRSSDRLHVKLNEDGNHFLLETRDVVENNFPSWDAARRFYRRIPEKKQNGYSGWSTGATDITAIIINHFWPREQIIFSEEAEMVFDFLLTRFIMQCELAKVRSEHKVAGTVPEMHDMLDCEELPLADYQLRALLSCYKQEAFALFMEQGTGKTPIVINRICNEARTLKEKRLYRALIVCPKNVRSNWRNEFVRFATVPGKVIVLRGGELDRVKSLVEAVQEEDDCEWSAVVCSYESIARTWSAFRIMEWDLCVLDESHFIKSTHTKRFKKMLQLRPLCKQRMCLTGTPITNSLLDLYAQFEFLGEGLSGFVKWEKFRSYYGKYRKLDQRNVLVGYKNVPLIQERLVRQSFMVTKAEALPDLPEKMPDVVEVTMTSEQRELYSKVRNQLAVEIEDEMNRAENKQLVINNVLTKLLRLAQITSGFITWDAQYSDEGDVVKDKEIDRIDPNPKLITLIELLKEKGPCDKTIVWACWIQDIKSIRAACEMEGIDCVTYYGGTSDKDRDIAERRFNGDPTCSVFIGNPTAGGTGLNLRGYDPDNLDDPCNCNHVIYYSQGWSMTARAQSEDRSHRRGTRVPVRYTDLCVPGTIDEEIRARVTMKRISAMQIQDVRNIVSRILDTDPTNGE